MVYKTSNNESENESQSFPELKLLCAVLGRAIMDATSQAELIMENVRIEARRWLRSNGKETLFTFASICDVLNLDIKATRTLINDKIILSDKMRAVRQWQSDVGL